MFSLCFGYQLKKILCVYYSSFIPYRLFQTQELHLYVNSQLLRKIMLLS